MPFFDIAEPLFYVGILKLKFRYLPFLHETAIMEHIMHYTYTYYVFALSSVIFSVAYYLCTQLMVFQHVCINYNIWFRLTPNHRDKFNSLYITILFLKNIQQLSSILYYKIKAHIDTGTCWYLRTFYTNNINARENTTVET